LDVRGILGISRQPQVVAALAVDAQVIVSRLVSPQGLYKFECIEVGVTLKSAIGGALVEPLGSAALLRVRRAAEVLPGQAELLLRERRQAQLARVVALLRLGHPPADLAQQLLRRPARLPLQLIDVRRQVRRAALGVPRPFGRVVGRIGDEPLDEVGPELDRRAFGRHLDLDHLRRRRWHPQPAQHREEDVVVLPVLLERHVLPRQHAGGQPDAEAPLVVRRARGPEFDDGHQDVGEVLAVGLAVLDAEDHPAQLHAGGLRGGGDERETVQQ
jgi:hypothetical protein